MGRRLDALLVLPPMYQSGRMPDYNPKEPMGLMYLAAELRRRGLEVEILDAGFRTLTIEETVGEIVARKAAVIGFSVLQRALPSLKLIVDGLRDRGVQSHICCGGVGATLSAMRILERVSGVDSIVLGDGELTFADLVGCIVSGAHWRDLPGLCHRDFWGTTYNRRADKPDLDSLAPPVRDMLDIVLERAGYATVVGSRGCYAACTFCSNSGFERASCGPGWRGRDPAAIVDEIEYLYREFGVSAIKFNDPNLFGPGETGRNHVIRICRELIGRELPGLHLMAFTRASDLDRESCGLLRRAGFERMLIGIESFDDRTLKLLRKGETAEDMMRGIRCLREADISIVPGFIIFNPYTTLDTLCRDLDMLEGYGFTAILSKAMRVFDGTALQTAMKVEGRLRPADPFDGYHEYVIDRDVATVYMCLKTLAVNWLNPILSRYQNRIWDIKRVPSFNGRTRFYSLQDTVFRIESRILRSAISWVNEGYSRESVAGLLEWAEREVAGFEMAVAGEKVFEVPGGVARGLDRESLTDTVTGILAQRPYDTFPEKYRWSDD